jgi:hypothetical protein
MPEDGTEHRIRITLTSQNMPALEIRECYSFEFCYLK